MTFVHWLVVMSAGVSIFGASAYIRDTLAGRTKPNRISWAMWAIAPLIGTGAALAAGADIWATTRIFLAGFLPVIIFGASFFNARSYWKIETFDLVCGACALAALVMWWFAGVPRIAVLLAAMGDGFAAIPTIRKAWKHPETETGLTFIMSSVSVFLVMPSIPVWNIENSSFQIYLIVINACILFAIYRKKILSF